MKMEKDAIIMFLNLIGMSDKYTFIQRGIEHIHFLDSEVVDNDFIRLIQEIDDPNTPVTVRAYGRGAILKKRTEYMNFLKHILRKDSIKEDSTNNAAPNKRFYSNAEFEKGHFKNYTLSHIWGNMSKNPYAFCALWNMCLTPFYIDPFTGHETNGELPTLFSSELKRNVYLRYEKTIITYNERMNDLHPMINEYVDNKKNMKLFTATEKQRIKENFKLIVAP